jgi:cytochrome c oxidase assembly protein subunit 11
MYEFQNVQNRRMAAQAIPSYAPKPGGAHFNKLECFCFNEYTLAPGERKQWPVAFVIDPKLSKDVTTITLSYTFFEVGGKCRRRRRMWPQAVRSPTVKEAGAHDRPGHHARAPVGTVKAVPGLSWACAAGRLPG